MVKIAQIGCGHWGKNLARNFGELGALGAIVDASPRFAAGLAETYDVPHHTDWDAVLEDDGIDAVALATPAPMHAEMAVRAMAAGKDVYIEKPLALTMEDGQAILSAQEKYKRIVMVGHLLQYHPLFIEMLAQVRAGRIGTLRYVYSNRLSLGKFRIEENVLWSFAPHDISMILSLVGEEPSHVSAQGFAGQTSGIADWCITNFQFANGARGHVQTSWHHPFKEQRLVAVGDEGSLVFEDSKPEWAEKLMFYPASIKLEDGVPTPEKGDPVAFEIDKGEPLRMECQHFIDCVADRTSARTDVAEGLRVLSVLTQAEAALANSLDGGA